MEIVMRLLMLIESVDRVYYMSWVIFQDIIFYLPWTFCGWTILVIHSGGTPTSRLLRECSAILSAAGFETWLAFDYLEFQNISNSDTQWCLSSLLMERKMDFTFRSGSWSSMLKCGSQAPWMMSVSQWRARFFDSCHHWEKWPWWNSLVLPSESHISPDNGEIIPTMFLWLWELGIFIFKK